ncbi:hypothetical protein I6H88_21405 [Elizabethkingia bruuniana]|uniref:Uncharacterized protein n=1 Tax=Elizabethkingia bruuniana TaxID=1756149 RepID=A0A7T7UZ87_9FLAO|nr:hypothetical protein [Elizabethkingia bruuniana]MCT3940444.1 hypothetical protein [Elizabethkingia anophelis]MCT4193640.1 hypothetical protein [Elizabethkingia anophelis]QDZ62229.1 hypothetical protein EVD20_04445 [Elizabethkingia bruuniana]QQN58942.1 hypothetical protein I6H88_21405 [Elizabethkingia bruuniana]
MNTYWEDRFISLLNKNPKTSLEVGEMEYAREQFEIELRKETEKLLEEIKSKGLIITNIWDLVNTKKSYPEAIESLTNHLSYPYHHKNKEGIIRALGIKGAGIKTISALLVEYPNCSNKYISDAIILSIFNIIKLNNVKKLFDQTNENDTLLRDILHVFINNKKITINQFYHFFIENFTDRFIIQTSK